MSALKFPGLARRTFFHFNAVLWEISQLLNTGLDRESLFLSIQLLEQNVNPEALAAVIKELKREAQTIQVCAPTRTNLCPAAVLTQTTTNLFARLVAPDGAASEALNCPNFYCT